MSLAFNSEYYLQANPDVAEAVARGDLASAQQHWVLFGAGEGRNPNAVFNTADYLKAYEDVAESGMNPLDHFLQFGAAEGRAPNASYVEVAEEFNADDYLEANEDVAAAVAADDFASAYQHWVLFGQFEDGRDATFGDDDRAADEVITDNIEDGDVDNGGDDDNAGGSNEGTFNVAQAKISTDLPDVYTLQDSAKNLLRTKSDNDPTLVNADVMENAARINVTDSTVTAEQADILADFKVDNDYAGDINIHIVANRDEFEDFGGQPGFINLEGLNIGEVVSDFAGEERGLNAYYEGGSSDTTFVMQGQENTSQAVYFEGYGDDTLNVAVQDNDHAAAFYFDGSDYAGSGSDAINTINIDSRETGESGVNQVTLKSDTANLKEINVSGGGDFELVSTGSASNVIESFNASEATGDVTLDASVFAGSSSVITGSGDDTITVGAGTSVLTGGAGNDTFAFTDASAESTITDFNAGDDTIDLSGVFESGASVSFGDEIGNQTASGDYNIVFNEDNGNTTVFVDTTNAGNAADLQIELTGTDLGLTADDFVIA